MQIYSDMIDVLSPDLWSQTTSLDSKPMPMSNIRARLMLSCSQAAGPVPCTEMPSSPTACSDWLPLRMTWGIRRGVSQKSARGQRDVSELGNKATELALPRRKPSTYNKTCTVVVSGCLIQSLPGKANVLMMVGWV